MSSPFIADTSKPFAGIYPNDKDEIAALKKQVSNLKLQADNMSSKYAETLKELGDLNENHEDMVSIICKALILNKRDMPKGLITHIESLIVNKKLYIGGDEL